VRNLVSIKKARTLMIGKFAGLSVLAAFAMIFVTPLMANPAMCGLPNHEASYDNVISGFTYDTATKNYTFTLAPDNTPIMIGTWLAVKDAQGKQVPVALEQPLTLRGNGAYHSNAPAIPTPLLAQNAELISGIPSAKLAPICKTDKMCKPTLTKQSATFVKVISGFDFNQTTKTYTFTEATNFPLSLGSFAEVIIKEGDKAVHVPASIVRFRGESLFTPVDKNDPSKGATMGGYLYVNPLAGDSTDQAQRLAITITQTQMDGINNALKASGQNPSTGWN
jgi:hypothetical protein